jgi:hypothetical protein
VAEAGEGTPAWPPLGAAALALAYALSSVAFVRAYERSRIARSVAWQVLLLASLMVLAARGFLPSLAPLAFVAPAARTIAAFAFPPADLRRLGLRELWVATSYTLLAAGSLLIA